MNRSFKPQLDVLEDRMVMDAAGTHVLYQDFFVPTVAAAVTGRITAIAVDPHSDQAARPLPVLMVIANRDFDAAGLDLVQEAPTAPLGWPLVPAVQKVREAAARSATNDVSVEEIVIMAEKLDTSVSPEFKYIPVRRF